MGLNEVEYGIAVDDPSLPLRVSAGHIRLGVGTDRLTVSSSDPSDENLEGLRALADRVLELLPHTPLRGTGVNFQWVERDPLPELLEVFRLPDNDSLADAGAVVGNTDLKRALSLGDLPINLSMRLNRDREPEVLFDFNFHHPTQTAIQAREHLNRGLVLLRETAQQLIRDAYDLEI
ncbi:hypothetical protein ACFL3S_08925 [Gemmatimonadota bacterium]